MDIRVRGKQVMTGEIAPSGSKNAAVALTSATLIFDSEVVLSMVISAKISEGETTILNADALFRGYPNFSDNLKKLGAEISLKN